MNFASNLKTLRKARGFTQQDAANLLGINVKTYASYEEERAEPNIDMIIYMAKKFGISIEDLIKNKLELHYTPSAA
jgi:transcriptional regulator with XRE-family HTH domain